MSVTILVTVHTHTELNTQVPTGRQIAVQFCKITSKGAEVQIPNNIQNDNTTVLWSILHTADN
jgi:hypothetical protein